MSARPLLQDDEAAFPVLEAVLVAILILSTVLFFTSLQRPTTATDEGGIDLGRLAADTLEILQSKQFTRAGCMTDWGLERWVGAAVNGTPTCVTDEVETFLAEVLPPGTQFQVRLDNGIEPVVLVPAGSVDNPRAARAAATYITPAWRAFSNNTTAEWSYPGQQAVQAGTNATLMLSNAQVKCIKGPTGASTGPDSAAAGTGAASWAAVWQQAPTVGVPANLPFGAWAGYSDIGCSSLASVVFVGLPDGTKTDYPVYGLQLVVWFGA